MNQQQTNSAFGKFIGVPFVAIVIALMAFAHENASSHSSQAPVHRIKTIVDKEGGLVACKTRLGLAKVYSQRTAGDMMVQASIHDCLILRKGANFYPSSCDEGNHNCRGQMIDTGETEYYIPGPGAWKHPDEIEDVIYDDK